MSETVTVKMNERQRFTWEVTQKGATCQSCGAPIWWIKTHHDKPMPVDEPEEGSGMTVSHFATCEHANKWRNRR